MESAEKASRRQREREEQASAALARKASSIVEGARRRLHDLVGRKKYAELRAAIQHERLALRELRQPPEGLKRDRGKDRSAAKRRVDALVRKFGVSASKVDRIHNDTRKKLRELLTPADPNTVPGYSMANHGATWRRLTGLNSDVVLRDPELTLTNDDPNNPHRWFWFSPPYSKFYTHHSEWDLGEFCVDRVFFSDAGGLIGSVLTLENHGASDGDAAEGFARSAIDLVFNAPVAGRVEVVIRAQCLKDQHEVSLRNEYGFSSASAHQWNMLYMQVPTMSPLKYFAVMSFVERSSDGGGVEESGDDLIRGQDYFAKLISEGNVPRATPSLVRVGSHNTARAFANDMYVLCRSTFMWNIFSVGIRVAP